MIKPDLSCVQAEGAPRREPHTKPRMEGSQKKIPSEKKKTYTKGYKMHRRVIHRAARHFKKTFIFLEDFLCFSNNT